MSGLVGCLATSSWPVQALRGCLSREGERARGSWVWGLGREGGKAGESGPEGEEMTAEAGLPHTLSPQEIVSQSG